VYFFGLELVRGVFQQVAGCPADIPAVRHPIKAQTGKYLSLALKMQSAFFADLEDLLGLQPQTPLMEDRLCKHHLYMNPKIS